MTRHPSSEASLATLDPGTNQPADLLALAAGGLLEVVASVPSWSSQSAAATVGQGAEKLARTCWYSEVVKTNKLVPTPWPRR